MQYMYMYIHVMAVHEPFHLAICRKSQHNTISNKHVRLLSSRPIKYRNGDSSQSTEIRLLNAMKTKRTKYWIYIANWHECNKYHLLLWIVINHQFEIMSFKFIYLFWLNFKIKNSKYLFLKCSIFSFCTLLLIKWGEGGNFY